MEKLNQILEISRSHHLPAVLSFLVGLLVMRRHHVDENADEILGENVPLTLIDALRR